MLNKFRQAMIQEDAIGTRVGSTLGPPPADDGKRASPSTDPRPQMGTHLGEVAMPLLQVLPVGVRQTMI